MINIICLTILTITYLLCLQAPMAVIGLTCRMDAISLFEKRVRSRFSHRQIYLLTKPDFDNFSDNFKRLLCIEPDKGLKTIYARNWNKSIQDLMVDPSVKETLKKIFNLNSKFRFLQNILVLVPISDLNSIENLPKDSFGTVVDFVRIVEYFTELFNSLNSPYNFSRFHDSL